MRAPTRLIAIAFVLALGSAPSFAGTLVVDMTVRVKSLWDWYGGSCGVPWPAAVGDAGTASYSYDTATPPQSTDWSYAQYYARPPEASMRLAINDIVVRTDPSAYMVNIQVADAYYGDRFTMISNPNILTVGGAPPQGGPGTMPGVSSFDLDFRDQSGQAIMGTGPALPTAPLDVARWPLREIMLGWNCGTIVFEVESATLGGDVLVTSPPSGKFVRAQALEPVLVFKPGTTVTSFELWRRNWGPLSYGYESQCVAPSPAPPSGRVVYLCPDINPLLQAGENALEWRILLSDGTSITKAVDWEILE